MRTPYSGMALDTTPGFFDFTSLLDRPVPLRMTAVCGFARAVCCCVILAVPGLLRALQPSQDAKPVTIPAATVQSNFTPTPTPQPAPSPALLQSTADTPVHPPSLYDEIVVTAVGDVMLGTTFPDESTLPPNDGVGLLTEVTPFLKQGDVVYGNLEGPIVDRGDSAKCRGKKVGTCFAFRVPTRYGKYLKDAGFTAMGLANNHAMDFGLDGRASSRQVLDAMQIAHTGEVGDIARLTVKGRKVAIIAFATYPGAYNFLDLDASLQTIRTAKTE
ncbi:MAG TPA: CapA family protein, partial [Candidatus Elarobacter sp.]|nr:CapA family protein [Candidatus Elarobacter sp.]